MPLIKATSHGITAHRARDGGLFADVLATLTPESKQASVEIIDEKTVMKLAKTQGLSLTRVAGNVYLDVTVDEGRDKDSIGKFWAVRGGKLVRLTKSGTEVDEGESIQAADQSDPESTLHRILADLEF